MEHSELEFSVLRKIYLMKILYIELKLISFQEKIVNDFVKSYATFGFVY